jgi:hypothetical protein
MNTARVLTYAFVGFVCAVSAQYCWGISFGLSGWRFAAGWALMVVAFGCWRLAPGKGASD